MSNRHITQALKLTGVYSLLGLLSFAHAASDNAWFTAYMLSGGKIKQACAKGNPYCAANVPAPPAPKAAFDANQTPCDSANDPCAEAYSKQMTENYRAGVADIAAPYDPCVMADGCAMARPWWQQAVKKPIQEKTIPYDPGSRPWTENKSCGTIHFGGLYFPKPCPTNNQ